MNYTLDNQFRCPWRWGKLPFKLQTKPLKKYGIQKEIKYEPAILGVIHTITIYYGRRCKSFCYIKRASVR